MDFTAYIAIYLPLFILFLIILPKQKTIQNYIAHKNKRKRGINSMASVLLEKLIGKVCVINTGSFGVGVQGTVVAVEENWLEIKTKKGVEMVNADLAVNIKVVKDATVKSE